MANTDLIYPEHKHPHGIDGIEQNEYCIWVCTECGHIFGDEEARHDEGWGHCCKSHRCRKGQRCESHLEPYVPEVTRYGLEDKQKESGDWPNGGYW